MLIKTYFHQTILFLSLMGAVHSAFADDDTKSFKNIPQLSLVGHATLHKPADELHLTIGVVTLASDAETTLKNNNKAMQSVVTSLIKAGLKESEFETGRFNIQPTYSPQPKNPPEDWKPSINGYEVTNSISIKTEQIDLAGVIIDEASKAGANSIDHLSFELKDPKIYRDEAITLAAATVIKEAKTLAGATGQKLVRLLFVTLDEAPRPASYLPKNARLYMAASPGAGGESLAPIAPGTVAVSASISVTYEIADIE